MGAWWRGRARLGGHGVTRPARALVPQRGGEHGPILTVVASMGPYSRWWRAWATFTVPTATTVSMAWPPSRSHLHGPYKARTCHSAASAAPPCTPMSGRWLMLATTVNMGVRGGEHEGQRRACVASMPMKICRHRPASSASSTAAAAACCASSPAWAGWAGWAGVCRDRLPSGACPSPKRGRIQRERKRRRRERKRRRRERQTRRPR
jgi:hypothetical protein